MNNEEYYIVLDNYIMSLQELKNEGVSIAKGIIGENLTKDDLFFCATLDRCLHLIDGIIGLLKERNLTCAGAILRLQMDNCMRTYAAFIAGDRMKVVDCLINGTPIKNEKDVNGKKMIDCYLKDEVTKIDSRFGNVYKQASSYIHLSEKAFYQTVAGLDDDWKMTIQIGQALPEERNDTLLECADAFSHFVKLHYRMLDAVVESKKKFDAKQK